MSKGVFKVIGTVAGVAGLVAGTIATAGIGGAAFAAVAGTVATTSSLVAGVVGLASAAFAKKVTAPTPIARGSITQTIIAAEPPRPYMVGECYSAGIMRHRVGYGATVNEVPNPNLWTPLVYSGVGPVEGLVEKQFDFKPISSHYDGFHAQVHQLGEKPESAAMLPPFGTAPGWTSSSLMSGCAAIGWNWKWDREGKVFSSGLPAYGAIWKGEKAYDPRLDDTQPGGVGPHRLGVESTYTYTVWPALHAGTYAFGRYYNGKKMFGIGVDADGIDWPSIAAWANDCEANDWQVHGTIYEGGEQSGAGVKAQNLDDICAAGGARWLMAGALLTFDWHRPRVSLATFTDKDIMADGADLVTLQSYRDRFSAVRPQYRSQEHNWEMITADKISSTTYVTEDGEEKAQTWALNLVKDNTQAGQLATYAMADSRELGPINIPLGVDWSFYRPGDMLTWQSADLGTSLDVVIVERTPNPGALETAFVFKTETNGKHAYALGQTAVAPPTPIIGQTGAERDAVAAINTDYNGLTNTPDSLVDINPAESFHLDSIEIGADVTSNAQITYGDVAPFAIQANSSSITTTTLPQSRVVRVYKGGVEQTSGVTTGTVTASPAAAITATASISSGVVVVSLTKADASGTLTVPVTFNGITENRIIVVNRTTAAPISGGTSGGTSFIDQTWDNINSTTDAQVTDSGAIVKSDASGQLQVSFGGSYSGDGTAAATAQYSTDGGSTWLNLAATVTGSAAVSRSVNTEEQSGFLSRSPITKTGLAASTDHLVRLVAKRTTGSGTLSWTGVNFTVDNP